LESKIVLGKSPERKGNRTGRLPFTSSNNEQRRLSGFADFYIIEPNHYGVNLRPMTAAKLFWVAILAGGP